jgi:hypothetical protein
MPGSLLHDDDPECLQSTIILSNIEFDGGSTGARRSGDPRYQQLEASFSTLMDEFNVTA